VNAIIFGATGMVGRGVLRECLLDPSIDHVLSIGRATTGIQDPKLREVVLTDFLDFAPIESELSGYDSCFFCLGVSSVGMDEARYRRITYDFTMSAARTLARLNPQMVFTYVSGAGTDSTEHGRTMWARVKGETENALLRLPFKAAYMFRPGAIEPLHGIPSKTPFYRAAYVVMGPLFPLLRAIAPTYITTTEQLGRAMIAVAAHGAPKRILETKDINAISPAR
jgi:uncharacterized protein YbjT (DUF2867 family)